MLQTKALTIYRDGKSVCKNLFVEIPKGGTLVIVGKNGSGKTTLVECLAGVYAPTSGQVLLDGHDVNRLSRSGKKLFYSATSIVLQHSSLKSFDTISHVLSATKSAPKDSHNLLHLLGMSLPPEKLVSELSFSERRRLELAAAMLRKPRLAYFDEPFLGLDQEHREKVKTLLQQLKSSGTTIILSGENETDFQFLNPEKVVQLN